MSWKRSWWDCDGRARKDKDENQSLCRGNENQTRWLDQTVTFYLILFMSFCAKMKGGWKTSTFFFFFFLLSLSFLLFLVRSHACFFFFSFSSFTSSSPSHCNFLFLHTWTQSFSKSSPFPFLSSLPQSFPALCPHCHQCESCFHLKGCSYFISGANLTSSEVEEEEQRQQAKGEAPPHPWRWIDGPLERLLALANFSER